MTAPRRVPSPVRHEDNGKRVGTAVADGVGEATSAALAQARQDLQVAVAFDGYDMRRQRQYALSALDNAVTALVDVDTTATATQFDDARHIITSAQDLDTVSDAARRSWGATRKVLRMRVSSTGPGDASSSPPAGHRQRRLAACLLAVAGAISIAFTIGRSWC
jgi:hypothetical protein